MPQQEDDLGELIVRGQRITFPFGAGAGGGGGGPQGTETTELDPNEPLPEVPCRDISDMTDEQKEKYLVQYIAQRVADLMRNHPQQRRELGSLIYRNPTTGNFHFTPFLPAVDHRAQLNWGALPQVGGQPDYSTIWAVIHNHPEYNLPMDPATGEETRYFDPGRPGYLLRPHSGDWATYRGIQGFMGANSPAAQRLQLLILGYTWDSSAGARMSLHSYGNADKPADENADTQVESPPVVELEMPCSE